MEDAQKESVAIENKKKEVLVDKILFLETTSDYYSFFKNMYLTLGRFCNTLLHFNRRENYLKFGKDKMNRLLLEMIEKEKPDYVFTWLTWDEFHIDTLLNINKVSPNTKTVVIFGDDTIQFYDFSRYYALLFNYTFTTLKSYKKKYEEDGIKNVYFTSLTDAKEFHPIPAEKRYDVTFIGSQKLDNAKRYEMIKYLKNNGINVRVFGFGWENHPDLKDCYGGPLNSAEVVKVISETKINLCFSKDNFGRPQMKAKIFELGACKSFGLCEYAEDYRSYFTEGKDIVFFNGEKELLEKVKYYLKNEQDRKKITEYAHNKVINEYALETELRNFIMQTKNVKKNISLPENGKKIVSLSEKEMLLTQEALKNITDDASYISFKKGNAQKLPHKDFFQIYSLEKSGKNVSCCNYYVNSKLLGDYLLFFARDGLNLLDKETFSSLLDINQIVVKKEYFMNHLEMFKTAYEKNKIDFITKETTSFVAIPLVRIFDLKTKKYDVITKSFGLKFMYRLYSAYYQKKIPFDPFAYSLVAHMPLKPFIFKAVRTIMKDKSTFDKLKKM